MLDQAESLRRLMNKELAGEKKTGNSKIITITSGKGGVGKSNFVVNLAIMLQKRGYKVLIFDADIGMGNDDVLMGLYPKKNIFDIIFTSDKIEDIIISGPEGVHLIPGGSGLNKIQDLTENQRNLFLQQLEQMDDYDYILMDTGAGISKDILSFISVAQELIIVTTPEPTALTDAYSIIKASDHFKLKQEANIVVNKAFTEEEAKETFNKIFRAVTRFLNIKVNYLGCIMDDRKLVQSVRMQKPVILTYPNCEAVKGIEKICNKIVGEENTKTNDSMKDLFRRLFKVFS